MKIIQKKIFYLHYQLFEKLARDFDWFWDDFIWGKAYDFS